MFAAFAFAASLVTAEPAPDAVRLTLYTEENPPFNYLSEETGKIEGVAHTVVTEMMRRAGIEYQIELLPWKRAYSQTLHQKNACIFGINRTPEREDKFLWISPLFEGPWSFFKKPGSTIELTSLSDLAPYRVVATSGYATASALKKTGHKKILLATSNERAMQLLFHGRVDLMLMGDTEIPYVARKVDLPPPEKALHFQDSFVAMGCNLNSDPALISRLQEINDGMTEFRQETYNNRAR